MTTGFLAVQTAIAAALAGALGATPVSLNRLRPIPTGQSAAIVVRMDQATGAEAVLGFLDWATSFAVECYARAAPGAEPASAIDTLFSDVWSRLSAIDSGALSAISVTLNPQVDWQYDELDTNLVCVVIRLVVQHRTPYASLSAA